MFNYFITTYEMIRQIATICRKTSTPLRKMPWLLVDVGYWLPEEFQKLATSETRCCLLISIHVTHYGEQYRYKWLYRHLQLRNPCSFSAM